MCQERPACSGVRLPSLSVADLLISLQQPAQAEQGARKVTAVVTTVGPDGCPHTAREFSTTVNPVPRSPLLLEPLHHASHTLKPVSSVAVDTSEKVIEKTEKSDPKKDKCRKKKFHHSSEHCNFHTLKDAGIVPRKVSFCKQTNE
jgi:hypothetical protein